MKLGKLGVWAALDGLTSAETAAFAQRVEGWGYAALWTPESRGRNALVHSSWLLANSKRLVVATGIANIDARDAVATANGQRGLAEQSGGRFLLGLGVSHVPLVSTLRGHVYGKPVATMRAYLDAMAAAPYAAPPPAEKPPTVITHADGAHPYNVPPEHTAEARRILGKDKLLCTEQMVLLSTDAAKARAGARAALAHYMALPNYVNNWRRLGFGDADFAGGGSDKFVDAIVAWGDEAAIRKRVQAHWDAGADHVCIQPLHPDDARQRFDARVLELLAPG